MAKVTPLFSRGGVQQILCDAADLGLQAVVIVGKKQDGRYYIALSETEDMVKMIGMIRMLEHDCLMALYELADEP